jgi:hypothetical protein
MLFFDGGPSYIARFVVAVIVDAVEGKSGRTGTDMLVKRIEAIQPLIAHNDSATSVIRVILAVLFVTATLGCCPSA